MEISAKDRELLEEAGSIIAKRFDFGKEAEIRRRVPSALSKYLHGGLSTALTKEINEKIGHLTSAIVEEYIKELRKNTAKIDRAEKKGLH